VAAPVGLNPTKTAERHPETSSFDDIGGEEVGADGRYDIRMIERGEIASFTHDEVMYS
jgi:hypothetical protein